MVLLTMGICLVVVGKQGLSMNRLRLRMWSVWHSGGIGGTSFRAGMLMVQDIFPTNFNRAPGAGKVYLNDIGEKGMIDKRGNFFKIGEDDWRYLFKSLWPRMKFTPEGWRKIAPERHEDEVDRRKDDAEKKTRRKKKRRNARRVRKEKWDKKEEVIKIKQRNMGAVPALPSRRTQAPNLAVGHASIWSWQRGRAFRPGAKHQVSISAEWGEGEDSEGPQESQLRLLSVTCHLMDPNQRCADRGF